MFVAGLGRLDPHVTILSVVGCSWSVRYLTHAVLSCGLGPLTRRREQPGQPEVGVDCTTRRYLDASGEGLRDVIRGHPSQIALRQHLGT